MYSLVAPENFSGIHSQDDCEHCRGMTVEPAKHIQHSFSNIGCTVYIKQNLIVEKFKCMQIHESMLNISGTCQEWVLNSEMLLSLNGVENS